MLLGHGNRLQQSCVVVCHQPIKLGRFFCLSFALGIEASLGLSQE